MALSLDEYRQRIVCSGLLSADELDRAIKLNSEHASPCDSHDLARLLVREQKLTEYQAQQFFKGSGASLVLGNYVILDRLGQGGMGVVYKALHRRLDRLVALKMLGENSLQSPGLLERFQREARAAARLEHPNIVATYDADEAGGIHFLVTQFVAGQDLAAVVRQHGPLSVEQAVSCVMQTARGLEYAHRQGVIHRDIKPENLLLARDGTVKILDLGLARLDATVEERAQLTNAGQILGTVEFMPPEQAVDTRQADQRSDIYSLGVTLWYLLSGTPVYQGDTSVAVLVAHREQPVPSLQRACSGASPELDCVFRTMISKTPQERQQSMSEVLADLARCRVSKPGTIPHDSLDAELRSLLIEVAVPAASEALLVDAAARTRAIAVSTTDDENAAVSPRVDASWQPIIELTSISGATAPHANAGAPRRWLMPAAALLGVGAVLVVAVAAYRVANTRVPEAKATPGGFPVASSPKATVSILTQSPLPPRFTNALGMKFVLLPKGKAWLGGGDGVVGESQVEISHDIYLGMYEVTQQDWEHLMGQAGNPSHFSRTGEERSAVAEFGDEVLRRFPVDSVSWDQCIEYVSRLNSQHAEAGWQYRLPTKDEWEYACRGGPLPRKEDYGFNYYLTEPVNTLPADDINCKASGRNRTCPVGSFAPNRLGLHDMHGNVFELCNDVVPGDGETLRILRGGGWLDPPEMCRAGRRNIGVPSAGYNGAGLRLALVRNDELNSK